MLSPSLILNLITKANPEKIAQLENVMKQSPPYLLLNRSHTPASGATEPAPKKKPIAALLGQIYGKPNAKTAEIDAKFTRVR
jgi:hypothetical protein